MTASLQPNGCKPRSAVRVALPFVFPIGPSLPRRRKHLPFPCISHTLHFPSSPPYGMPISAANRGQPFPILPPSPALGLVPAGTALIGALDLMGTHGDGSCIARVANSGNAAAPAFWAVGPRTYVAAATGAVPRAAWDIPPTSPAFAHGHFPFVPSGQRLGGAAKAKHGQTVPADVKTWPFHRAPPCWNGHALLL